MTRRLACLALPLVMQAQAPKPQPPGLAAKLSSPPRYSFPAMTPPKPATADRGKLQIGNHRPLPAGTLKKGRWTKLPDGRQLWRLEIRSPGAVAMRLHFAKFKIGPAKVWIYAATKEAAGPYTGTGIDETGSFWSDTLSTDAVTVEFETATGAARPSQVPFEIAEISHQYR